MNIFKLKNLSDSGLLKVLLLKKFLEFNKSNVLLILRQNSMATLTFSNVVLQVFITIFQDISNTVAKRTFIFCLVQIFIAACKNVINLFSM